MLYPPHCFTLLNTSTVYYIHINFTDDENKENELPQPHSVQPSVPQQETPKSPQTVGALITARSLLFQTTFRQFCQL